MAGTVTFKLKDTQAKNETLIYLVFYYGQMRIKLSTGEKINPKFWNKQTHRAREVRNFPEYENLNNRLNICSKNVLNAVRDHLNNNKTIHPDKLRNDLLEILRPTPQPEPEEMTFIKAITEYIKTSNKSPRTILSYGTTFNVLKQYQDHKGIKLNFDIINMDFYNEFIEYLTKTREFSKNTIGDHIKKIKVFMNYALDKEYTKNTGHLHRKFQTIEETAQTIYLNDSELLTLYNLDLSNNPRLDRVRDLFIIGSYTGLRFSDLSQLTPDKFIKDGTRLRIKTQKTGEIVEIPLHHTIKQILHKYSGGTPRALSNQKMNEYLKELGQKAGINDPIIISQTRAGFRYEKTFEKWEIMTVHTARRSFATNMFLAEVPTISIMKITGHRTERAFMKYIKITQEENANKLSKHPYFLSPLKIAK